MWLDQSSQGRRSHDPDVAHQLTIAQAPTDLVQPGTRSSSNAFSRVWRRRSTAQRPPVPVQRRPVVLDHHFELFRDISKREFKRIEELFTIRDVPQGHLLARQGDVAREFFLLLEGRVAISIDDMPNVVLDQGCHFGEMPLLDASGKRTRMATAHTLEPSRIAVANRRQFRAMLDISPTVARRVTMLAIGRQAYVAAVRSEQALSALNEYPAHLITT